MTFHDLPCFAIPSTLHILSQVFHLTHCLYSCTLYYIYTSNIRNVFCSVFCSTRTKWDFTLLLETATGWKAGWSGVAAILQGLRFFPNIDFDIDRFSFVGRYFQYEALISLIEIFQPRMFAWISRARLWCIWSFQVRKFVNGFFELGLYFYTFSSKFYY